MNYTIIDCEQRSEEWFAARLGRLTASVAGDVTAKGRGSEESVKRRDLRFKLALERVNQRPLSDSTFQTAAMRRGIELEPEARAVYEAISGRMLQQVGFVASSCGDLGCSCDGVEMDDAGRIVHFAEFKCPEWAAHWDYLQTGKIGKDYEAQIALTFLVTGAETCDWMSYNPDFPKALQTKLIQINRDAWQPLIDAYAAAAKAFMAEVAAKAAEIERAAA